MLLMTGMRGAASVVSASLALSFSAAGFIRLEWNGAETASGNARFAPAAFVPDGGSIATIVKPGQSFNMQDWKTSTGAEIRSCCRLAALLGMLNSCSSGVSVVNILTNRPGS